MLIKESRYDKEFKDNSLFRSDSVEDRLDKVEKTHGKKARKEVEQMDDEYHLKEVDKSTGMDFIAKVETEKIEQAQKQKEEVMNYVDDARNHDSYRINLAEWGMYQLMNQEMDPRFEYHCIPTREGNMNIYGRNFKTKDGIIFVLKAPNGAVYIKAMGCSYIVQVDVKAVGDMCVEVENTYDSVRGVLYESNDPASKLIL